MLDKSDELRPNLGHILPTCGDVRRHFVEVDQSWVDIDQNVCQVPPRCVGSGRMLVQVDPTLAKFGRIQQTLANFGRHSQFVCHTWTNSANFALANNGEHLGQLGQCWSKRGGISATGATVQQPVGPPQFQKQSMRSRYTRLCNNPSGPVFLPRPGSSVARCWWNSAIHWDARMYQR